MYRYSQKWFYDSEIYHYLKDYLNDSKKITMLEIGCFEGLSTCHFCDKFLSHEDSSLDAVDPFLSINDNDHSQYLEKDSVEDNFDYNTSICNNKNKLMIHKITSDKYFETNKKKYDFIYIDGCHLCDFIKRDMENSFENLNEGGIMWMDDYLGGPVGDDSIKQTMDEFIENHKDKLQLLHSGYQLAIKKS